MCIFYNKHLQNNGPSEYWKLVILGVYSLTFDTWIYLHIINIQSIRYINKALFNHINTTIFFLRDDHDRNHDHAY